MSDAETNTTQATAPSGTGGNTLPNHDRADIDVLYKIYVNKRLISQADFYKSRIRENQSNANFTFLVSTAVMSISALVAAVSAVVSSPFFSLLSAILPALAALLAAFRQLYGWERQSSIYQDAMMGLERVKLLTPDKDGMATADLSAIYPQLVTGGEEVFTGEVNQWGQFVQNADKSAPDDSTDGRVTTALMGNLGLTDDQIDTIRKIVAAGAPKSAFSEQNTITVRPEEASALPAGANSTPTTAPVTVTTTNTVTTAVEPKESTTAFPIDDQPIADAVPANISTPITVTTTRVDTTTVERVIAPEAIQAAPVGGVESSAPEQEAMGALTPGAENVDTPQQEDIEALTNHQEFANEPPPPEAASSLSPGAMHVDMPEAPPDNPDADPNANG